MNPLTPFKNTLKITGTLAEDVPAFLIQHGHPKTAKHCGDVAQKSRELAIRFGADAEQAEIAGWLQIGRAHV